MIETGALDLMLNSCCGFASLTSLTSQLVTLTVKWSRSWPSLVPELLHY